MSLCPTIDKHTNAIYRDFMARWHGDEVRTDVARVTEVHIRTIGGEVAVTATAGSPHVDAVVTAGPPLTVTSDGGVLTIDHDLVRGVRGMVTKAEASVIVAVPVATPVTIRTVAAEVTLAGVGAGASVNTVSAPVVVSDVSGALSLRTVSGDVDARAVDGDVHVNTVSGHVTLEGTTAELSGRSVSGDLTFDLHNLVNGSLTTVSGDVVVRLPANASGSVDLTTATGTLDCAFAVDGSSGRRRLSGVIGSDSDVPGRLTVRTMSGDVAVLSSHRERVGDPR